MRSRYLWLCFGIAAGTCLLALAAQLYVDRKLRDLLVRTPHGIEATSLGNTKIARVSFGRETTSRLEIAGATIASGLIRRRCDGELTWGVGARVEVREIETSLQASSRERVELTASGGCFDAEISELFGELEQSFVQGGPIQISGFCGPEVSELQLRRGAEGRLFFEVALADRSQCLKRLSILAPNYPKALIPERVRVRWESRDVRWSKRKLQGRSPVAIVAEISRLLEDAELKFEVSWKTGAGEEIGVCLRRSLEKTHSNFEIALGVREETLQALTKPFVSEYNREVLVDLRSDEALCDGSARGLFFSSDLQDVRLAGVKLPRREEPHLSAPGFRTAHCGDSDSSNCRYRFGVIQLTEKGRLLRPEQLEAIARSLGGQSEPDPLLLVYLHGWRHDASPTDGNLRGFEGMVRRLAERVHSDSGGGRPVYGIYVSWPGRMFDSPSANKLATFWDRLETARRLGEPSSDLESILRRLRVSLRFGEQPRDRDWVLVGHSMGADPLLHVVSRLSPAESPKSVLLVNPALSVARAEQFRSAGFSPKTTLVSYGSVADQVTQQFFPLGEAVEFSGETRRQLAAATTTVNNSSDWIDGHLRPSSSPGGHEVCFVEDRRDCVPAHRFRPPPGKLSVIGVDEAVMGGHAEFMTSAFVEHLIDLVLG